jgi:hypothetical protein
MTFTCADLQALTYHASGLCERLGWPTADLPRWGSPGWRALRLDADPWADLLAASGRAQ